MTDNSAHYRDGTAAGHKGTKSSGREAAEKVTETLGRRHAQMLAAFEQYGTGGATCFDVANDLNLGVDLIRPRVTELEKRRLLFDLGREDGPRGAKTTRYSIVPPPEDQAA
jgi:hypothetical protein